MKRQLRIGLVFSVLVVVSLALGALTPTVVYAEGDLPEAPPPETAPPEEPEPEDAVSAVEALAESGSVIVQVGQTLPLASQAALEVVCDPDPWFYCTKPDSTYCVSGRTIDFNTFAEAKAYWVLLGGYGYMYLYGSDTYAGENFDVSAMPGLKGIVWDTTHGTTRPEITSKLTITNFSSGFTLQGLSFIGNASDSLLFINGGKGTLRLTDIDVQNTQDDGIGIRNYGPVILTRVSSSRNFGRGAMLETAFDDGTGLKNYGGITINSSSFNGNGTGVNSFGLIITSGGATLLNGVSATGNGGSGAGITSYALPSIVIKNSVFSHNVDFDTSADYGEGLIAGHNAGGSITLENVTLDGNNADGAFLFAPAGSITLKQVRAGNNGRHGVYISGSKSVDTSGAKNVTVLNSSFYYNNSHNLSIHASGAVYITNLASTYAQGGMGLLINNKYGLPQPVTILGAVLTGNLAGGIRIDTNGSVLVAGIQSNGNNLNGLVISQTASAVGNIVVSGSLGLNRFNNSKNGYGVVVVSYKNVSLTSIQAVENGLSGLAVDGKGIASNVTLVNVETSGGKSSFERGADIETTGVVLLDRVTAMDNAGTGIYIDNDNAAYARTVTVRNSTSSNNGGHGIWVSSVGVISLINVTANNNHTGADGVDQYGAYLINNNPTLPTQVPQGITVSKATFSDNEYGMEIRSLRKVSISSVTAWGNKYAGILIRNKSTAASPVVVSGVNQVSYNSIGFAHSGLLIESDGLVTVSGVTAISNGDDGLYVIGSSSIVLSGIQAVDNNGTGVYIRGIGTASNVTLVNVVASGSTQPDQNGVDIETTGVVLLDRVTAMNNTKNGIYIDNSGTSVARAVTVRNTTASDNSARGFLVYSVGAITLSNVVASGNSLYGAYLNNANPGPHVLQGTTVTKSTFDGNQTGLAVISLRQITLTSVNASGNTGSGILADNSQSDAHSPIVVNGINQFNHNGVDPDPAKWGFGLSLFSSGTVSVTGVNASWNGWGLRISNPYTPATVTISNSQLDNNLSYGIWAGEPTTPHPTGLVTLSGVRVFANGFANDAPGVYIISNNKVSFIGGYYMGNAGAGIYLDLYGGAATYSIAPSVVLFGNDARGPYGDGDFTRVYYP